MLRGGREPLCKFLGKDMPSEPFPRKIDADQFNTVMANLHRMQYEGFLANVRKEVVILGGMSIVTSSLYMARR